MGLVVLLLAAGGAGAQEQAPEAPDEVSPEPMDESAPVPEPAEGAVEWLLLQSAEKIVLSGGWLELRGVGPATVYVSSRSQHEVGHMPTASFVKHWGEVRKSLPDGSMGATLSLLDEEEAQVALTLRNPMLKSGNLRYEVEVRQGPKELSGDAGTLFIDVTAGPMAPESIPGNRRRAPRSASPGDG